MGRSISSSSPVSVATWSSSGIGRARFSGDWQPSVDCILFDRRGTGASDPVALNAIPTWEEATEDILAVLDAVGSEHAAIYAEADAGPIAMLFAATHPDRVSALV